MDEFQKYFEYLKTRSKLGAFYRQYILYPKICRHIEGKALDIGCGIGDFLKYRSSTVGVDINPYSVEWCKDKGLDARIMEVDRLPFEDGEFDAIILDNVLEHIQDPSILLSESHRVLRIEGKIIIGVPGIRGYASDDDHKVFYDFDGLNSRMKEAKYSHVDHFYMPLKSEFLNKRMRQYCLYSVFCRDS